MSHAVTLEIPDDIAKNYSSDDELKRSLLESVVLSEFQKGLLSIRQSAETMIVSNSSPLIVLSGCPTPGPDTPLRSIRSQPSC